MKNVESILESRRVLLNAAPDCRAEKAVEEGGCGVVGLAASVKIKGRHIFQPSIQMHNRGNGKGGGIAAAGFDPAALGVTQEILDHCYLLNIALMNNGVQKELEDTFITPLFDIEHARSISTVKDFRSLGLETKPPDVKQYFVRVKNTVLNRFSVPFSNASPRDVEDEFVWQNSFKINQKYYASLGEKKAFVLSHARNLMILKIVGYAENVVKYYQIENLPAHVWIAHQRYPTKGRVWHPGGAHPFIGMNEALVHNGDFANYASVTEYLRQRNMVPQFLTDTEVSVMIFDLWSRIYKYPLEYVIEGLAPTTELDFDRLPKDKREVYAAIQSTHIHGSPDGPWFFIIARSLPEEKECQLLGITDTAMLRPQVFALSEGEVKIGLCASEKQAIDAALESISSEDSRFRPIADKYWNARGGSHTDGGAFVFKVKQNGNSADLSCLNKFGQAITAEPEKIACCFSEDHANSGSAGEEDQIRRCLEQGKAAELFNVLSCGMAEYDFAKLRWIVDRIVHHGAGKQMASALTVLTLLNDMRYDLGHKKRSSVLQIVRSGMQALLNHAPALNEQKSQNSAFRRITWQTRDQLRPPVPDEKTLVIDATQFEPEGEDNDASLIVKARQLGWNRFIVFNLKGQRFHGCGLGPASNDVRIDLYGSSGDYAGSGMDGCQLTIHGDAQDQLGQIVKQGKLVVYGNVGQTFLYGAKGGSVFIMGSAAGRPLINAVGRPRVVINGTCLDFLAESFMAGDALKGGGFVIVNGVEFDDKGVPRELALPYPGSNLFSLASGGALYIRDPRKTLVKQQLNGGAIVKITDADWDVIRPFLEENEALFNIKLSELLIVDGMTLPPERVYCKIMPIRAAELDEEFTDEEE
jgi:glutamate synthase domain-containing protein 1/glutamate synthase domain-containing protein 3